MGIFKKRGWVEEAVGKAGGGRLAFEWCCFFVSAFRFFSLKRSLDSISFGYVDGWVYKREEVICIHLFFCLVIYTYFITQLAENCS